MSDNYWRKLPPSLAKRFQPPTALLNKCVSFDFTPAVSGVERERLRDWLSQPSWYSLIGMPHKVSRFIFLYCDACQNILSAVFEWQQSDGSKRPITSIHRATAANEPNWWITDLEAGAIVWTIKHLCHIFFPITFKVYTDHKVLVHIRLC